MISASIIALSFLVSYIFSMPMLLFPSFIIFAVVFADSYVDSEGYKQGSFSSLLFYLLIAFALLAKGPIILGIVILVSTILGFIAGSR